MQNKVNTIMNFTNFKQIIDSNLLLFYSIINPSLLIPHITSLIV